MKPCYVGVCGDVVLQVVVSCVVCIGVFIGAVGWSARKHWNGGRVVRSIGADNAVVPEESPGWPSAVSGCAAKTVDFLLVGLGRCRCESYLRVGAGIECG